MPPFSFICLDMAFFVMLLIQNIHKSSATCCAIFVRFGTYVRFEKREKGTEIVVFAWWFETEGPNHPPSEIEKEPFVNSNAMLQQSTQSNAFQCLEARCYYLKSVFKINNSNLSTVRIAQSHIRDSLYHWGSPLSWRTTWRWKAGNQNYFPGKMLLGRNLRGPCLSRNNWSLPRCHCDRSWCHHNRSRERHATGLSHVHSMSIQFSSTIEAKLKLQCKASRSREPSFLRTRANRARFMTRADMRKENGSITRFLPFQNHNEGESCAYSLKIVHFLVQ